jgi:hypothetical protein
MTATKHGDRECYANFSDEELLFGIDDIPRVRELARRLTASEAKADTEKWHAEQLVERIENLKGTLRAVGHEKGSYVTFIADFITPERDNLLAKIAHLEGCLDTCSLRAGEAESALLRFLETNRAEAASWNKYETRVEGELSSLRRSFDKIIEALLEATEERGWLADQCNVLHSHLNASPPLGMTGWLEAAIFARENRTTPDCCAAGDPCCSEPGAPARPNPESSEWVCDCSCHPKEA